MALFSSKIAEKDPPKLKVVGPRKIQYDHALVGSLMKDHAELKDLYVHIGRLLNGKKYEDIPQALRRFKTRLQSHIMVENVRFYVYLEQSLDQDRENLDTMRDFRHEMGDIARAVVKFIKKYAESGITLSTHSQFEKDYNDIGNVLTQRIDSEENDLYPLYESMG